MFRTNQQSGNDQQQAAFCGAAFRNKFEKFQQHFFDGAFNEGNGASSQVPANIVEHPAYFEIQLFAAGRKKELFKVVVENNLLQVSYEEPITEQTSEFRHQEYVAGSFNRAFKLDEQVLSDNVQASFEDGVLTIILAKNPETNKPVQEVHIS